MSAAASVSYPFRGSDGASYTNQTLPVDAIGNVQMSAGGAPAATAARQDAILAALALIASETDIQAIGGKLDTLHGDVGGNHADLAAILAQLKSTLAISVANLPLPSGAATAAAQAAGNGSLSTLVANTPTLGQKLAAGSVPVVLSTDGPFAVNFGFASDGAAASDAATTGLISLIKRGLANWTTYLARVPVLGPALKAASVPVTIASDQVLATLDANGAAFSTAVLMTAGQPYTAGRSVGVNATSAGTITLTLAGGGNIPLPVYPGWQTFPFAATAFTLSGGASGPVYTLN